MVSNVQELSVTELSRSLKRTVEEAYGHVRVRGEISGYKRAASGHVYMALKDQDAVIDAVCWKGNANRLSIQPEDGLEIIATGRLTTFPGRSKYQIIIEQIEHAGEGALLKLLEERRKRLTEEGLFDQSRKRALPFLPEIIGVITSPTGAVIRDILHRLNDRFPRNVLLWPVLVQGDKAARQIVEAIEGFNALPSQGSIPRPDLLIVARGGGALEDLWSFNDEDVVRAAAASRIPLVTAIGHETDTTLIDFAGDHRAPTPTAAAEMAVPVRSDLVADLNGFTQRIIHAASRGIQTRRRYLEGLAHGIAHASRLTDPARQRLDDISERLGNASSRRITDSRNQLTLQAAALQSPGTLVNSHTRSLGSLSQRLETGIHSRMRQSSSNFTNLESIERMATALRRTLTRLGEYLERHQSALEALGYKGTLKRGYAVIRDVEGNVISHSKPLTAGDAIEIEFADSRLNADIAPKTSGKILTSRPEKKKITPRPTSRQEELFS